MTEDHRNRDTRDPLQVAEELWRVVEAVADIGPILVIGGKTVCFYCDELLPAHDEDCAYPLARKLMNGTRT